MLLLHLSSYINSVSSASYKEEHESFMGNLKGTSMICVLIFLCHGPASILLLKFIQANRKPRYLRDVTFIVIPMVLSMTILSNISYWSLPCLVTGGFVSTRLLKKYRKQGEETVNRSLNMSCSCTSTHSRQKSFLSMFKGLNMLITCIAILAVDFRIFPRRFAKTDTFGIGVMDIGVGTFIVSSALTSAYARGLTPIPVSKSRSLPNLHQLYSTPLHVIWTGTCDNILAAFYGYVADASGGGNSNANHRRRGLQSVISTIITILLNNLSTFTKAVAGKRFLILVLGLARFLSVKLSNYHERPTEYGSHWNFFITLYCVWTAADIVHRLFPRVLIPWLSILMLLVYQAVLVVTPLTDYIMASPRTNLLNSNREGIFQLLGFIPLYLLTEISSYQMFFSCEVDEHVLLDSTHVVELVDQTILASAAVGASPCTGALGPRVALDVAGYSKVGSTGVPSQWGDEVGTADNNGHESYDDANQYYEDDVYGRDGGYHWGMGTNVERSEVSVREQRGDHTGGGAEELAGKGVGYGAGAIVSGCGLGVFGGGSAHPPFEGVRDGDEYRARGEEEEEERRGRRQYSLPLESYYSSGYQSGGHTYSTTAVPGRNHLRSYQIVNTDYSTGGGNRTPAPVLLDSAEATGDMPRHSVTAIEGAAPHAELSDLRCLHQPHFRSSASCTATPGCNPISGGNKAFPGPFPLDPKTCQLHPHSPRTDSAELFNNSSTSTNWTLLAKKPNRTLVIHLIIRSFVFWLCWAAGTSIQSTSRRLCNLPFVFLILYLSHFILLLLVSIDMIGISGGGEDNKIMTLEYFNSNQLLLFIIANILTGVVNKVVRTLYAPPWLALLILIVYSSTLVLIAWNLSNRPASANPCASADIPAFPCSPAHSFVSTTNGYRNSDNNLSASTEM